MDDPQVRSMSAWVLRQYYTVVPLCYSMMYSNTRYASHRAHLCQGVFYLVNISQRFFFPPTPELLGLVSLGFTMRFP
jgi:hypothetical protein